MTDKYLGPIAGLALGLNSLEREQIDNIRSRYDGIASLMGATRSREPSFGESTGAYRRSLANGMKRFTQRFINAKLEHLDDSTYSTIEPQIYHDAEVAAMGYANRQPRRLAAQKERDEAGRLITRWHGDNMAWMQHFMADGASCKIR